MKNKYILTLYLLTSTLLVGCVFGGVDDSAYQSPTPMPPNYYSRYEPVIMKREAFESSISFKTIQPMIKAGKIYVKDNYIFIVDENKGAHLYNNQNPINPLEVSYLELPGATDIAIRNNQFYVNQATDLVSLTVNLSNQTVDVTKRIKNVFPAKRSPDGYTASVKSDEVVVDWKLKN